MPDVHLIQSVGAMLVWAWLVWTTSALGFLIVRPVFASWPDQGYGLAKVSGPFLVGCAAWLLVSAFPLSLSFQTAALAVCLMTAVAAAVAWHTRHDALPAWRTFITLDAVWLAVLCVFAAIRSWSPSIIGAERPMDHALLAALLQQQTVPPIDPWLAGFVVNYHYVGHALWTPLALLAQQPPWVVYNLVLITLPAQLLLAAWSVGRRLHAAWAWAGAAALVFAAPLLPVVEAIRRLDVPRPSSTRVIPGTINEFPFFSLTWGDLHAHVLALPLLVGVAASLVRLDEQVRVGTSGARVTATTMLCALLATAAVLTSSWDVAPMMIAALWAVWILTNAPRRVAVVAAAAAAATTAVLAAPVLASFRPPSVPMGWEWEGSPLVGFLVVQGSWLLPAMLLSVLHERRAMVVAACVSLGTVAVLVPSIAVRLLLAMLAVGIWRQRHRVGRAATALTLSALLLLVAAECVWLDDVYGWDYRRMNTVFKWHLHAIVLLTLGLPALLHGIWAGAPGAARRTGRTALVALAVVSSLSSVFVLASRYSEREPVRTLSGLAGLARRHPGDAAAVEYLWRAAPARGVVLEAVGQSYTYGSRISTMTGVPTLLGWTGHEQLWRRGAVWQREIDARVALVDDLYAGPAQGLRARLRAADVRYVVVGPVERRRYTDITIQRFADVGDVIVQTGGTSVLRVH